MLHDALGVVVEVIVLIGIHELVGVLVVEPLVRRLGAIEYPVVEGVPAVAAKLAREVVDNVAVRSRSLKGPDATAPQLRGIAGGDPVV